MSRSVSAGVLAGPLNIVTICTANMAALQKFYSSCLEMSLEGPVLLTNEDKDRLKKFWDIPDALDFECYHHIVSQAGMGPSIRVIKLSTDTDHVRQCHHSYERGFSSLGLPSKDITSTHQRLKKENISPIGPIREESIMPPIGTPRYYKERLYAGPDFVRCALIEKANDQTEHPDPNEEEVAAMPFSYAGLVTDRTDEEIIFYTHVLGMNLLSDSWHNSTDNASPTDAKAVLYRQSILHSYKDPQTLLKLVDYQDGGDSDSTTVPRLPSQGLVMWTFEARDIGEVLARAHAKQIKIYRTPRKVVDPIYGQAVAMTILSPTGTIVEVFSKL